MKITKKTVDALKAGQQLSDSEVRGFRARCLPSGVTTFSFRYRSAAGKRHELPIGLHGTITCDQARLIAQQHAGKVAGGNDPARERKTETAREKNTVNSIIDGRLAFLRREGTRSADRIAQRFDQHVRPAIGETVIYDLERDRVSDMLLKIAAQWPQAARCVRANLNAALEWHRQHDGRFNTIVMPAMKSIAKPTRRERVLGLDELRDVWLSLDDKRIPDNMRAFVRVLLLTACRRCEISDLHSSEIDGDAIVIPPSRYKTNREHVVPLNAAIRRELPKKSGGFVFASDGCDRPLQGFSQLKDLLDRAIAERRATEGRKSMPPWRLHDLRRSARTHMAAAGISDAAGEAVLGHAKLGVLGVYNQHKYQAEKADALERWAAYLDNVVSSSPDRVVPLAGRRRAARSATKSIA